MNLDISKLSIDELKTFKKFNREFLPKIKKFFLIDYVNV